MTHTTWRPPHNQMPPGCYSTALSSRRRNDTTSAVTISQRSESSLPLVPTRLVGWKHTIDIFAAWQALALDVSFCIGTQHNWVYAILYSDYTRDFSKCPKMIPITPLYASSAHFLFVLRVLVRELLACTRPTCQLTTPQVPIGGHGNSVMNIRREFSQLASNHVFCYGDVYVILAIMDLEFMAHENRKDRRRARLRLDRRCLLAGQQLVDRKSGGF